MADVTIRPGTDADRPAIADLQIASWRTTYAGLLPDDYLGQPVHDDLHRNWADMVFAPTDVLLLAEDDGQPVGFIYVKDKHGPYVDNLHVRPDHKGRGIGRRLMAAAAQALVAQGDDSVWLTVMEGNDPALAFYTAMGGAVEPPEAGVLYGQPIRHMAIRWTDLPALAAR